MGRHVSGVDPPALDNRWREARRRATSQNNSRRDRPRASSARADAPLLRVRERRHRAQRAPRIPGRLDPRPSGDGDALHRVPRTARGRARQAARQPREQCRSGGDRTGNRPRQAHQARPRRRTHRRPRQILDPRRHRGGRHRRRVPRRRWRSGHGAGAAADRAAAHRPRAGSAPPWTRRPACRSSRRNWGSGAPSYVVTETGPDHSKSFHADVVLAGDRIASGHGSSKKHAEMAAALDAWAILQAGAS